MDIPQVLAQGVWNASCVVLLTRGCNLLWKRRENKSVQPYVMPRQHQTDATSSFITFLPNTLSTRRTDSSMIAVPSSLWNHVGTTSFRQISPDPELVTQVTEIVFPGEIAPYALSEAIPHEVEDTNTLQAVWDPDRKKLQAETVSLSVNFGQVPGPCFICSVASPSTNQLEVSLKKSTIFHRRE